MSEILEELEEETVDEIQFTVDGDEKADALLQERRDVLEEKAKWDAHYDALKARSDMKYDNRIFKIEKKLRDYFFDRAEKGLVRKLKTQVAYDLPTGKIFMKHPGPKFERDDKEIIEWLRENAPELIKTKEEVDWSGMKEAFSFSGEDMIKIDSETGEIFKIPGVRVIEREDEFKVEDK